MVVKASSVLKSSTIHLPLSPNRKSPKRDVTWLASMRRSEAWKSSTPVARTAMNDGGSSTWLDSAAAEWMFCSRYRPTHTYTENYTQNLSEDTEWASSVACKMLWIRCRISGDSKMSQEGRCVLARLVFLGVNDTSTHTHTHTHTVAVWFRNRDFPLKLLRSSTESHGCTETCHWGTRGTCPPGIITTVVITLQNRVHNFERKHWKIVLVILCIQLEWLFYNAFWWETVHEKWRRLHRARGTSSHFYKWLGTGTPKVRRTKKQEIDQTVLTTRKKKKKNKFICHEQ